MRLGVLPASALGHIDAAASLGAIRSQLLGMSERTQGDISKKLAWISAELGRVRIARVPIFREMARLERKRGGDLVAVTYLLRIMRWLGRDHFGDLEFVTETLIAHGFPHEAAVADAMYGDPMIADERCLALLSEQYRKQMTKPDLPLEILDDRRDESRPKVAVISSLYAAESKLPMMLGNLAAQSLVPGRNLEIILVDSASPTREYEVFKSFAASHDLPIVYARSANRETIQAAWNRGIKLARAPYLCFLGADEGLHPDCLGTLSHVLDARPDVDWVIADSIVTEVDRNGIYAGDVMSYDRAGYNQALVYLETCYLSWVGGLYRKSIHERFGYYDETFRAAGDTEFKGRILTHINTLHVPKPLGIFNNFPEERTTHHPRAEIEDLRAWYLHRTQAGIRYSFDAHPAAKAEGLLLEALSYRKSYCRDISTDFDIAFTLASYLARRGDGGAPITKAVESTSRLLNYAHIIDTLNVHDADRARQLLTQILLKMRLQEETDLTILGLPFRPRYHLFNDNRYEQHWWSWSAP